MGIPGGINWKRESYRMLEKQLGSMMDLMMHGFGSGHEYVRRVARRKEEPKEAVAGSECVEIAVGALLQAARELLEAETEE